MCRVVFGCLSSLQAADAAAHALRLAARRSVPRRGREKAARRVSGRLLYRRLGEGWRLGQGGGLVCGELELGLVGSVVGMTDCVCVSCRDYCVELVFCRVWYERYAKQVTTHMFLSFSSGKFKFKVNPA